MFGIEVAADYETGDGALCPGSHGGLPALHSQPMQMPAEDGCRLSEDCQKVMQKITTSLTNGSPAVSSCEARLFQVRACKPKDGHGAGGARVVGHAATATSPTPFAPANPDQWYTLAMTIAPVEQFWPDWS